MSKYSPLAEFLHAQKRDEVPLTFAEIERIIGGRLPASHLYRSWWSNNSFNSVMTKAWLGAGFRSADVDIKKRRLVFRRIKPEAPPGFSDAGDVNFDRPAISPRHPMFGAMKGLVRVAPGTDLTEPADPDWERMSEA